MDGYPLEGRDNIVDARKSVCVAGGSNGSLNETSKSANVSGASGENAFGGGVGDHCRRVEITLWRIEVER